MAFDALCLVAGGAKVIYDFPDCCGEQFGGYVASVIPWSNPEGCEKVAGGRSVAQTSGKGATKSGTLEGCQNLAPFQGAD
jgi:hypothetical protein